MWRRLRFYYLLLTTIARKEWKRVSFGLVVLVLGILLLISSFSTLFVGVFQLSQKYTKPTYIEGVVGTPGTFNPLFSRMESEKQINSLVFRGLTKIAPTGEPVTDLAESFEIKGEKEYIFKLKKDVLWQDGRRFSADDVVYTVETAQNPIYDSEVASNFKDVVVSKIDDYTVDFKLKEPFAPFLTVTTVGIIPKHIPLTNYRPIGTGAFKFTQIKKDFCVLEGPKVKISFRYYPNLKTVETALKLGEVHGLVGMNQNEAGINKWSNFAVSQQVLPYRLVAAFFNIKNDFLAEKAVRQALSYASPKEEIVKKGSSVKGQMALDSLPNIASLQASAKERYPYSLDRAAAVLTNAGWKLENGLRVKDNKKLSLKITTIADSDFEDSARKLKAAWEKLGIQVQIEEVFGSELRDQIVPNRQFQVLLSSQLLGSDPDQYVLWHTTQIQFANISSLSSAKVDKFLEDGRKTLDQKVRTSKYQEFTRLLLDEAPAIFLYYPDYVWLHSKRIRNIDLKNFREPEDRFENANDWKIKRPLI